MKMAHDFAAARIAAQHCPELVARGPRPEEREAQITAWRRDLANHLAQGLGGLLSGDRISAEISPPEWLTGSDVIARIGPVAANSLLRCGAANAGEDHASALLSFDHATALALAERSFGGDGHVAEPSIAPLPRSALLISDEIAALIAHALGAARSGDTPTAGNAPNHAEVILRSENAARLRAFAPDDRCALLTLRFANQENAVWIAQLAMTGHALDNLLPSASDEPKARQAGQSGGRADGAGPASFGAIPLGVRAVLAEVELSLSQLERLAPGDTIPLAMARSVPLWVGDAMLGHGSIGTIEDRMALRLINLPAPLPSKGFAQ